MTHGPSPWRCGRKVGRTIYAQVGDQPSNEDVLIGVMDTPELAARAVEAVNRALNIEAVSVADEQRAEAARASDEKQSGGTR